MKKLQLSFAFFVCLLYSLNIFAQGIPETINYQGILKDASGVVVPNGAYTLAFKLYDVESGGTAIWSESKLITVTNGIINTQLGSVTPISPATFNAALWLGITVATGSELTPRIALTSVPYSFYTMNVADGQVVKSLNGLKDNVNLVAGSNVTITPSGNDLTISATGGGTGIGGSGTANYLPLFTNGTTLGNSIINQSGNTLGINTSASNYTLNLNCVSTAGLGLKIFRDSGVRLAMNHTLNTEAGWAFDAVGSYFQLHVMGAAGDIVRTLFTANDQGNVGIGTTNPSTRLDVSGTVTVSGTSNEINRTQTGSANLVPIAYATVAANGAIYTGGSTDNVTLSSHTANSGKYQFTITGEDFYYQNYVCIATPLSSPPGEISWGSIGGMLIIYTANSSGTATDKIFSFVIYKK
jgi:hypothetical protein